jgi:hypothetical protein
VNFIVAVLAQRFSGRGFCLGSGLTLLSMTIGDPLRSLNAPCADHLLAGFDALEDRHEVPARLAQANELLSRDLHRLAVRRLAHPR